MGNGNVQADAQLTMARILRPYDDFEDAYQGQDAVRPIVFHPTNSLGNIQTLDFQSNMPGYDPRLLGYTPVPMGSRICLWIPYAISRLDEENSIEQIYRYIFYWRIKSLRAMLASVRGPGEMAPYHMKDVTGRPDRTQVAANQLRYVIPVATRSIVFGQAEPAGTLPVAQNLREERIEMAVGSARKDLPILPAGNPGYHQQGVLDPNEFVGAAITTVAWAPLYEPFWFDCEGDELAIAAVRDDAYDQGAAWNFNAAGADSPFSSVYGRNQGGANQGRSDALGIYLFTGSNP